MRGRLLANEAALADYEILEMLLFLGIPRRDTKPQAKGLINQFGSLAATLSAGPERLQQAGLPPRAAKALDLVVTAAQRLARPEALARPMLDSWAALIAHLDPAARASRPPGWSALLLNNRNQLLQEPAWPDDTPPDQLAREVLRRALDTHATAAILVCHQGQAAPHLAPAHRLVHDAVARAAGPLAVVVHDMVALGAGDWVSLRQQDARR